MLKKLFKIFASDYFENAQRNRDEAWLAQSTDLVELEHRQRQLTYGYRNVQQRF